MGVESEILVPELLFLCPEREVAPAVDAAARLVDEEELGDVACRAVVLADRIARDGTLGKRRLVGEVLSVAQRLFARHQSLTSALTQAGGGEFDDLDLINEVMADVLGAHDQRMIELGLRSEERRVGKECRL